MKIQFTPEQVMEIGEVWGDVYLHNLPTEKRIAGLKPEERIAGLKPEERIAGLNLAERLAGIKPEELEAYLAGIKHQKASNGG